MRELRSSRRLIQKLYRREKAVIDQVASSVGSIGSGGGRVHSPMTATGLVVEEQIRKAWQPNHGGLPIF
jgi:hypothetical protein